MASVAATHGPALPLEITMKTTIAMGAIGLALAAATPASAQSLLPFFGPSTASTMEFRAEALRGDAYEIESSRIALDRSRNPAVRSYAREIIRGHQKTTDALLPPGTSLNATGNVVSDREGGPFDSPFGFITAPLTLPVTVIGRVFDGSLIDNKPNEPGRRVALDARRQAKLAELQSAPPRRFTATYTAQQVQSHQEAVALYRGYAANGDLAEGRLFATQALPTLENHLDRASRLDARFGEGDAAF